MNAREKRLYETLISVCDNIVKKELNINEDVNLELPDMSEFNEQFLTDVAVPIEANGEPELYLSEEDLVSHGITRDMCCDVMSQCDASVTGYFVNGDLQVIGSRKDPKSFDDFLQKFAMIYEPNNNGYETLRSLTRF